MSNTYKEIRKITGNNKSYAEAALETLKSTCDWITGDEGMTVYLRSNDNDWVAILDVYCDEGTEFTSVRGNHVTLSYNSNSDYIAVEVAE